jgi:hypothetical protein
LKSTVAALIAQGNVRVDARHLLSAVFNRPRRGSRVRGENKRGNAMSNYNTDKNADLSKKQPDKYTGMRELNLGLSRNVILCAVGGGILGAILSLWATTDIGVVSATVIVMAILSGIFGMFL